MKRILTKVLDTTPTVYNSTLGLEGPMQLRARSSNSVTVLISLAGQGQEFELGAGQFIEVNMKLSDLLARGPSGTPTLDVLVH